MHTALCPTYRILVKANPKIISVFVRSTVMVEGTGSRCGAYHSYFLLHSMQTI